MRRRHLISSSGQQRPGRAGETKDGWCFVAAPAIVECDLAAAWPLPFQARRPLAGSVALAWRPGSVRQAEASGLTARLRGKERPNPGSSRPPPLHFSHFPSSVSKLPRFSRVGLTSTPTPTPNTMQPLQSSAATYPRLPPSQSVNHWLGANSRLARTNHCTAVGPRGKPRTSHRRHPPTLVSTRRATPRLNTGDAGHFAASLA